VELRLTERGWEKAERKRGGYAHGCEDAPVVGGEVAHSFGVELHCEEAVLERVGEEYCCTVDGSGSKIIWRSTRQKVSRFTSRLDPIDNPNLID
jgi:hypothetical protein